MLNTGRRPVVHGDSGAGCYFDNGNGEFQLVCILFAGRGQSGQYGWAFPATTAERLMGLRFGNTPPAANAGPDQTVTTGDLVTLDGRRSRDPDRDPLTYKWRQVPGVGGTSIGTGPNPLTSESTYTFEAPEGPVALSFKLTVTDSFGESASDVMNVTVKPVEIWGEWMDTDPVEYRRDGLTRERKQIRTSNLGNVEVTWIHDPEPAEPLPPTPGNWVDTDPVVYRGDGLTRERKQTRTWSDGRVEIRWVSDPEPVTPPDPDPPPTPGPWMDTDPVEYRSLEGLAREKKQTRTWSDGRVEVRWNPAPVTPDPDPDPDPSPDPDPDPPPTAGE